MRARAQRSGPQTKGAFSFSRRLARLVELAKPVQQHLRRFTHMAYDSGLAQRIRGLLDDRPGITERKMFGGLAFMLDGKMFVGLRNSTLMARVGPERYEAALAMPNVREMDFTGRPMKGFVYVEPPGLVEDRDLAYWVESCAGHAASLPPKKTR